MNNILLCLALSVGLIGCTSKYHLKERAAIIEKATLFCSCHGGVEELRISEYSSIPDGASLRCLDGASTWHTEDIIVACGQTLEK